MRKFDIRRGWYEDVLPVPAVVPEVQAPTPPATWVDPPAAPVPAAPVNQKSQPKDRAARL